MKNMFLIVFGSAATKSFATGNNFPRDIDIISNMPVDIAKSLATKWFRKEYPDWPKNQNIEIDFHEPEMGEDGNVLIPCLSNSTHDNYHVLYSEDGNIKVSQNLYERGIASMLRIYGDIMPILLDKIEENPQKMSLIPEGVSYFANIPDRDKYYTGLKGTRNAWAHVSEENRQKFLRAINCPKLFQRLMGEDPKNWDSSQKDLAEYAEGYSLGIQIYISSNSHHYVMRGNNQKLSEEEAIKLIFG